MALKGGCSNSFFLRTCITFFGSLLTKEWIKEDLILPLLTSTTIKIYNEMSMKIFYTFLLEMVVGSSNFLQTFLRINVPSEIGTAECMQYRPPTFYYINRSSTTLSSYFFHQSFFNLCYFCFYSSFGNRLIFFRTHHFHFSKYPWVLETRNLNI